MVYLSTYVSNVTPKYVHTYTLTCQPVAVGKTENQLKLPYIKTEKIRVSLTAEIA